MSLAGCPSLTDRKWCIDVSCRILLTCFCNVAWTRHHAPGTPLWPPAPPCRAPVLPVCHKLRPRRDDLIRHTSIPAVCGGERVRVCVCVVWGGGGGGGGGGGVCRGSTTWVHWLGSRDHQVGFKVDPSGGQHFASEWVEVDKTGLYYHRMNRHIKTDPSVCHCSETPDVHE